MTSLIEQVTVILDARDARVREEYGLTMEQWAALDYNAKRAYRMLAAPLDRPKSSTRRGDNEEYAGEAASRGLDARGFNLEPRSA